jgi:glutamate racemase
MIGVFDSGVGGISVLLAIRDRLPQADLIYVADRGRAPYGPKSLEEVQSISHDVARWLISEGAELLVVACNTASAAALDTLRSEFETPIVGMEPAVKPAAESTNTGIVGVFATQATFQGRLFESVVNRHASNVKVLTRACPDWVGLVEGGLTTGPVVEESVAATVETVVAEGADVLVLGCTHFSFLKPVIERVAGPGIHVIDPAGAVAAQTARVAGRLGGNRRLVLAASGDTDEFTRLLDVVAGIQYTESVLPFTP